MVQGKPPSDAGRATKQYSKGLRQAAELQAAALTGALHDTSSDDEDFDADGHVSDDADDDGDEDEDEEEEEAAAAPAGGKRKARPGEGGRKKGVAAFVDDAAAEDDEEEEEAGVRSRWGRPAVWARGARCAYTRALSCPAFLLLAQAAGAKRAAKRKRNRFVDDEVEVDDASDEVCLWRRRWCGWSAWQRETELAHTPFASNAQDGEDEGDDGIVDDEAEVEAAAQEQAGRLHARVEAERAAGNKMTDEQLEAYVRERCEAFTGLHATRHAFVRAETGAGARARWHDTVCPARCPNNASPPRLPPSPPGSAASAPGSTPVGWTRTRGTCSVGRRWTSKLGCLTL